MILEFITEWFTAAILIVGGLHVLFFLLLWAWARRDLRRIASSLEEFTAGLHHRSRLEWGGHLADQVDAFVADIDEALADPHDRQLITSRLKILDERRIYLDSFRFETSWNVARTGIEAYPLLGVLGTIFALWLAMRTPTDDGSAVSEIVSRFGNAIDSTFAGLAMAIVLMLVNSLLETLFQRLLENRRHVREVVLKAKRELIGHGPATATTNESGAVTAKPSDAGLKSDSTYS